MKSVGRDGLRGVVLGLLTLLFVSCAAEQLYSGPRRSKEQVAILKERTSQFFKDYSVSLWEVNGERVNDATLGIEVLPGRTRVTVLLHTPQTASNPLGYREEYRTFTARAGHTYYFEMTDPKVTGRPRFVIRDERTD